MQSDVVKIPHLKSWNLYLHEWKTREVTEAGSRFRKDRKKRVLEMKSGKGITSSSRSQKKNFEAIVVFQ